MIFLYFGIFEENIAELLLCEISNILLVALYIHLTLIIQLE